jgi:hypothetical protein
MVDHSVQNNLRICIQRTQGRDENSKRRRGRPYDSTRTRSDLRLDAGIEDEGGFVASCCTRLFFLCVERVDGILRRIDRARDRTGFA